LKYASCVIAVLSRLHRSHTKVTHLRETTRLNCA
jgi:hypothetical protein